MKNPQNICNKNNCTAPRPCPLSPLAAESLKKLAESYDDMTSAAARMAAAKNCPDFLQQRAWQRAERVGRVLDDFLDSWEEQACPALCFDCGWQQCERGLAIIEALTPCSQWFTPELWAQLNRQNAAPTEDPPT